MQILSIDEVREIQIEMLEYLEKKCIENNLRYYLAYGTLLGAVRHQGYIPWDDDIDVLIPRVDYEIFLKVMEKDTHSYIKAVHLDNCKHYLGPYAMLINTNTGMSHDIVRKEYIDNLGVYIDIFPMDGRPEGKELSEMLKKHKRLKILNSLLVYKNPGSSSIFKSLQKKIGIPILRLYGQRRICKKIEKLSMKYEYETSKFVGEPWGPELRWIMKKSWFGEGNRLSFEGKEFVVPERYEKFLENGYGDYMKLPPKEQRVPGHSTTLIQVYDEEV